MDCPGGLDLTHAIDRMSPGYFPFLQNVRVIEEGRLDGRPGYTQYMAMTDQPNSIRRLNDPGEIYGAPGYTYVGGGGSNLYIGSAGGYAVRDGGYSGNPLSLITFRPDQSPGAWMYVYDQLKQVKVRPDGVTRPIGVAPPLYAPVTEYGIPNSVEIADGQTTTGWTASGGASAPALGTRVTDTIGQILYNTGSTGWCCIVPSSGNNQYADRMQLTINAGGGTAESVVIREYHPSAGANTTVAAIFYDVGTSGMCSLILTSYPAGVVERNSVIALGSGPTYCRVLEVNLSPDGSTYSLRLSTASTTIAASATVVFNPSLYVYTVNAHSASEAIVRKFIGVTGTAATGEVQFLAAAAVNASVAGGRPIDPANDYFHITLYFPAGATATSVQVAINFTNGAFSFTAATDCYLFTIPQGSDNTYDPGYYEVILPLSSAQVLGNVTNLNAVWGVAVQYTGNCIDMSVADCYLFGTYGPLIQPNSPEGYVYQYRYRDSTTGDHSVPGPQTRYQLYPLREDVIITTVAASGLFGFIDTCDIYREGGLITEPTVTTTLYVGSTSSGGTYTDELSDDTVLALNQPPDLAALQPWPTLGLVINGTCDVVGTSIITASTLNQAMLNNTVININGVDFLTYGQPPNSSTVQLTQSGGNQIGVPFTISSPTYAGQPLPYAFGPLEGPFAPVVFALGDPINGGLLYYCNPSDADSASDQNTLEVSTPSSNLVSGAVWNGLVFVGDQDTIFCTRYSYLTTLGASTNTSFQWNKVPSPSGIWSRWACCATPLGMAYLGRDGIYIATDSGAVSITDEKLYSLFPHEGQQAIPILEGTLTVNPVDMTRYNFLRMSYCDGELRFVYPGLGGNFHTLIYQIYKKRWFDNTYNHHLGYHYLEEFPAQANLGSLSQSILALDVQGNAIVQMGGDTDEGNVITSRVMLPSQDGGDERSQKLYVDAMIQAGGSGTIGVQAAFNSNQTLTPVGAINIVTSGIVQQFQENLASLAQLALYRNVGALFTWTGGPDGPQLYAYEVSGYIQPYLSQFLVTQFITLSFPGWKHMRRAYPALISVAPVLLTIKTQDGRTYGPYVIPSTNGQFRVLPQMLDQTIKDLAFAFQLDGQGNTFALFPSDFVIETKQWNEDSYISLAVFKS